MTHALPLRVAHLTTVDMSLELLLGPQLSAVVAAGGEALGISSAGPFVDAVQARGARHIALAHSTRGRNIRADVRAACELWGVLRRDRPTVLHTHNPKPGLYGRIVGRLAGVPIVVNTVHGLYATPDDPWARRALVYALEAVASRFSDLELVQNAEDVVTMRRWRLAGRDKMRHLGNGVDLGRFRPGRLSPDARRTLRAEWGAGENTVVVGTVGRLVAEKGYPELFDAMTAVGPDVRLVVVGGEDDEKADALGPDALERAGQAGTIFLGHRTDIPDLLAAFDVFVLASHREGQPRAAMEAAATGLPIVATDIRGCRQVVDHDVTGLLVQPGSAPALAAALSELRRSAARREAMGAAARAKACREFDERDVVARVFDAYRAAAARRGIELGADPGGALDGGRSHAR